MVITMKIVVVRSPKALRGLLRILFRIKKEEAL
ncbi:MAG: stage V sporulation protein SpoVM [Clostridiales bacterium]|nr:stage V sporulation protein SpoVM [Clostridiales bacterium]